MKKPPKPFEITNCSVPIYRTLRFRVQGFWSGDTITVEQGKDLRTDLLAAPALRWSCGGRDPNQTDDLTAAENFAEALAEAIKIARRWEKHVGKPIERHPLKVPKDWGKNWRIGGKKAKK